MSHPTPDRCPRCDSPAADLHPANARGSLADVCDHEFHGEYRRRAGESWEDFQRRAPISTYSFPRDFVDTGTAPDQSPQLPDRAGKSALLRDFRQIAQQAMRILPPWQGQSPQLIGRTLRPPPDAATAEILAFASVNDEMKDILAEIRACTCDRSTPIRELANPHQASCPLRRPAVRSRVRRVVDGRVGTVVHHEDNGGQVLVVVRLDSDGHEYAGRAAAWEPVPAEDDPLPPTDDTSSDPEVADEADLLYLILDNIEYDFCEDNDDVQGNWKVVREGEFVTVEYLPYDVSPYPAQTMRYRIERLS